MSGLQLALERALKHGLDAAKIETRHQMVAQAAQYVMGAVPDALARFGLDENGVRQRLEARLGYVAPLPSQSVVFGATLQS